MQDITTQERNTLIDVTCDYFKTRGIYVVPDMFHETEEDDHKFIMQAAWLEYTIDAELPIQYSVNFYTETEPDCFVLSITNNGGLEHTDEYQTFHINSDKFRALVEQQYQADIEHNPLFRHWL